MRRSSLEVRFDLLKVIAPKSIGLTRAMYGSNSSWTMVNQHLNVLLKIGLITEHAKMSKQGNRKFRTFTITQKGIDMLRHWNEINGRIRE